MIYHLTRQFQRATSSWGQAAAAALALVLLTGVAIGQDSPGGAATDRATPNQSVALETSAPETTPEAKTSPEADGESENRQELKTASVPPPHLGPVRTLKRRSSGTSALSRPVEDDVPWYQSGIGALSIVLGVIGALFLGLRRLVPSMRAPDGDVLKVVARSALTPKQTLSLIQVGRRFVLVAVSAGRVDPLCEVNDADEVAELILATGAKFPRQVDQFDTQLRTEAAGFETPGAVSLDAIPASDGESRGKAVSSLLERLKNLQRTG